MHPHNDLQSVAPDGGSDEPTGRTSAGLFFRLFLLSVLSVTIIGAFAIGSHPVSQGGSEESAPGAINVLRYLLLGLAITTIVFSIAFLVYIFWPRKNQDPDELVMIEQSKLPWWLQLILGTVPFLLTVLMLWWLLNHRSAEMNQFLERIGLNNQQQLASQQTAGHDRSLTDYWLTILSVVAVLALILVPLFLAVRHHFQTEIEPEDPVAEDDVPDLAADLSEEASTQIEAIMLSADPRLAVIEAYAGMEAILARHGLIRKSSETAAEFATRVVQTRQLAPVAMQSLTSLFELARYSRHDMDDNSREEAIRALVAIRDAT